MESAQDQHDQAQTPKAKPPKGGLRALMKEASGSSSSEASSDGYDPIASAMAQHPGLTREQAEADAAAFGY